MKKFAFIARMPDETGALHRAAAVCRQYAANINRLQYDRRIDPATVFFEVTADEKSYDTIARELAGIGYLQTSLKPPGFLKFAVYLPHRPGAPDEFLSAITRAGANIGFVDFDDAGRHPDRLTVSLPIGHGGVVDALMEHLKSRYRREIIEYDNTGDRLDDTVFYVKFAQSVRTLTGKTDEPFLLSFLSGTNHIAQELMDRGHDPKKVFSSVLATGQTLRSTSGTGFSADIQHFQISDRVELFCIQLPCGGNIFLFRIANELVMVDTGYGIYFQDVYRLFARYRFDAGAPLSRIIVTHADADHCGAAGYYGVPVYMHPGTEAIIRENNRAYGSRSERSVPESFYTKMINLFSTFSPPENPCLFPAAGHSARLLFPVLSAIRIGDVSLEVLESLGGHLVGQVYLYSAECGLLFTADSLINFSSLTPERSAYNALADFLVTSVNVDSGLAHKEREALFYLAVRTDRALAAEEKRCLVCGGHGAVSVPEGERLVSCGTAEHCTIPGPDHS
jgi:glyoxylase-like metal-dependent hydrolase (beta-lactamase superfamily II)